MRWLRLAPLAILFAVAGFEAPAASAIVLLPDAWHDEFGRNNILVLLISTGRSLAFGAGVAAASVAIALLLAVPTAGRGDLHIRRVIQGLARIVESVPLMLWVLAAFATVRGSSSLVAGVALGIAVIPVLTSVLAAELDRIVRLPYVDAARMLGVDPWRVTYRHVLPNAAAVLGPLFIQVLGVAAAIRGATGLLGFGRRMDYDLGVLLLRGREQLGSDPFLLLVAVASFLLLFIYLDWLARSFRKPPSVDGRIEPY
jgi:peptide/nickel transport system permease protein